MDITDLSVVELVNKIKNREISAAEITRKYLDNIHAHEESISAFMEIFDEDALKQANSIDEKIKKGIQVGKLAGIPIAIKDNICIKNTKVTCSSKILGNYVSPYDATVITKLKEANAVLIGKTNMDEFAMGSSTENSAFKVTKNPWDLNCIPGGSSGGSAASVGSNMVPVALGSDTGGSVRQPGSYCGVVGMKPTYGRVSRYGLVAFASSLDQIGPFAKNIEDCALLLTIISGYDNFDSTSVNLPVQDYEQNIKNDIKGLKVGLPKEYFIKGLDPEVELAVRNAVKVLADNGAVVKEISLPHTEYAVAVYYIIAPAEASSNLARYDGIRYGYRSSPTSHQKGHQSPDSLIETYKSTRGEGFGPEVKRRIILGTYTLSAGYYEAYYSKAQKVRTLIKHDFDEAFKEVDIVVTPTSPTVAFRIGEKTDDPLKMYLSDIFTIPCNLAGIPGISLPCGFSKKGLPIGLQIMGRSFDEETILKAAYNYEKNANFRDKKH